MSLLGWVAPNGAKVIDCRERARGHPSYPLEVTFDRHPDDHYNSQLHGWYYSRTGVGLVKPKLSPPTPTPLLGWQLPCGATVISSEERSVGVASVRFDRHPCRRSGKRSDFTEWCFDSHGRYVAWSSDPFPDLRPPIDLSKPLRLSDGTPVNVLTTGAAGAYPVIAIIPAGTLLRCTFAGHIAGDTRKLENVP